MTRKTDSRATAWVLATLAIGTLSPTYRAHLSRYRSVFFLDVVGHRDQTSVLLSRTAIAAPQADLVVNHHIRKS